jgi:hypothetical protein
VSRETSPAGFSYRTGFPFLTFAGFRLWRTTSRFVAFLGTLSGSYWYAVFRSPLRPTSRDKTDCTHYCRGCQHGFGDWLDFVTNGVKKATSVWQDRINGRSIRVGPRGREAICADCSGRINLADTKCCARP